MKYLFTFISFWAFSCLTAQNAILITSVPLTTPEEDVLYLACSANSWDPGNQDWTFNLTEDGYYFELPESAPSIFEGKITRGAWSSVEGNEIGGYLPNRTFDFSQTNLIEIEVLSWEDLDINVEWPDNLYLVDEAFFMPELNRNRRIRILLPSEYFDTEDDYPVLYMHDGQNLFVAEESFAGEWEVDEAMLAFENAGYAGAIIVAIDNGMQYRIDEYTPWAHPEYGGGDGENYVEFIVSTLKPFIDETYRTLSEREHNGIMGSSLGGLISHYAGIGHQDVFSKIGVFSPSYWFTDDIYDYTEWIGKEEEMKFYILGGGQESPGLFGQIESMVNIMEDAGFDPDAEINFQFDEQGQHSEWFWADYFPDAFQWLYMDDEILSSDFNKSANNIQVYPNPTPNSIRLLSENQVFEVSIIDQSGRILKTLKGNNIDSIDLGEFESGLYYLLLSTEQGQSTKRTIKL